MKKKSISYDYNCLFKGHMESRTSIAIGGSFHCVTCSSCSISAVEFDEKFEKEDNLVPYLQTNKISKPGLKARRVSVDFPEWMVQELDHATQKLGITRQSLIKVFISEKLKETH